MKKLLSILAGLAMTATTATTVVSCSWGCSSDKSGDNGSTNGNIPSGKVNMGEPKVTWTDEPDGKGNFVGDMNGKDVSVNAYGYLVDATGTKSTNDGFGKRIAGFESDGKTPKKDASGTIYLDNDGYRIKEFGAEDPEVKNGSVTAGWHRVTSDGAKPLSPDTGKTSRIINQDPKTKNMAPYVDDNGNLLDKDGYPVDKDGNKVPDKQPADPEKKYTDVDKDSKTTYKPKQVQRWTLNGDTEINLGKNDKSVVIGDNTDEKGISNGTAVALNPNDPDSSKWHVIPSGKYAGMKVKLDGNKVVFEWPVDNKQIDNIISKNTGDDSPVSADNNKVNLPIEYKDGKDGTGKTVNKQSIVVDTPWDGNDTTGSLNNSSFKWWVDSSMTKNTLDYNNESTTARVYVSSALYTALTKNLGSENAIDWKNKDGLGFIQVPHFDDKLLNVSIAGYTAPEITDGQNLDTDAIEKAMEAAFKKDDSQGLHYLELNITSASNAAFEQKDNTDTAISFSWQKEATNDDQEKETADESFISGASSAMGTDTTIQMTLSKIDKDIVWDKASDDTVVSPKDNSVEFNISKSATAVDYSAPTISIKKKSSDDKAEFEPIDKYLKDGAQGIHWDRKGGDNKLGKLVLTFADGVLDKSQYEIKTDFNIINDNKEHSFGPASATLSIDKTEASTNEKMVVAESYDTQFKGYDASWKFSKLGEYVDTDSQPVVNVQFADSSRTIAAFSDSEYSVSWDKGTKELKLHWNTIPSDKQYSIGLTFKLLKGFSDVSIEKPLTIEKDKNNTLTWGESDQTPLSFHTDDYAKLTLGKTKESKFDIDNIDEAKSSVVAVDSKLLNKDNNDYSVEYAKDGSLKIVLNKEIPYQENGVEFVVTLTDKNGTISNPEIVSIQKNEAMTKYSQVIWNNNSIQQKFDNDSAKFEITNKELASKDVDLNSLKISAGEGNVWAEGKDYKKDWNSDGDLVITVLHEQHSGIYKFKTEFSLKNGYEKSKNNVTSQSIEANKDTPLMSSVHVEIQPVEGSTTLNDGATAKYAVLKEGTSEAIDLTDTSAIKVTAEESELNGKIKAGYNAETGQIEVSLISGEITGGSHKFDISFAYKNVKYNGQDMGYDSGVMKAATVEATKTVPNKDEMTVYWNKNVTDLEHGNEAVFELDKDKSGKDLNYNELSSIKLDGEVLSKDRYSYEDGKLTIKFSDEKIQTFWDKDAKIETTFELGNGYEQWGKENFKDGIPAPELTVTKNLASDKEKNIAVDDVDTTLDKTKDKNDVSWKVSSWGTAVQKDKWNVVSVENTEVSIDKVHKQDGSKWSDPTIKAKTSFKLDKDGNASLSYADGDLWYGTYVVKVEFDLAGYTAKTGEKAVAEFKFKKTEPNAAETAIVPVDNDAVTQEKHIGLSEWYVNIKFTFDKQKFGTLVDYSKITILVDDGKGFTSDGWKITSTESSKDNKTFTLISKLKVDSLKTLNQIISTLFDGHHKWTLKMPIAGFSGFDGSPDLKTSIDLHN